MMIIIFLYFMLKDEEKTSKSSQNFKRWSERELIASLERRQ